MATTSSDTKEEVKRKEGLGWIEWLRGWFYVVYEFLFQRITASHLQAPMPLPPINDTTCMITESTSGIGREIARLLRLVKGRINQRNDAFECRRYMMC